MCVQPHLQQLQSVQNLRSHGGDLESIQFQSMVDLFQQLQSVQNLRNRGGDLESIQFQSMVDLFHALMLN
jgi:hypothetical protein